MPKNSERTPGEQEASQKRRPTILTGLFVLACSFPPFINSIDNPSLATLHGLDVFRLVVAGALFGFGLALILSGPIISRVSKAH